MKKCLLIETKDKRQFFTHEKNLVQLIEFSKTFDAQMSIVKLEKGTVLELEELVPAICNSEYKDQKTEYEILENKSNNKISNSQKIKIFIEDEFKNNRKCSLNELRNKFSDEPSNNLSIYMNNVKTKLKKNGFNFKKINVGQYEMI